MKTNFSGGLVTSWLLLVLSLVLGLAQAQTGPVGGCDRYCLEAMISKYLITLRAHDASFLAVTPDVKYVENNEVLPIGTGEWAIAGSLGTYCHIFADPEAGQVAAITTITENGVGVIYLVRLKVEEDGNISEIETQITRDEGGAALYEQMKQPEEVWLEPVPQEQRLSRAILIAQTNKYYSGMENNDPKGNYSFFDRNCTRLEDATQTTNVNNGSPYGHSNDTIFASLSCEAQFQTGFLGFVTKIRERRFPVVDEERQVVYAVTILDHNATVRFLPDLNGTKSPIPAYFDVPRTLQATEGFRLRGDKLFRIEMTLTEVPYGVHSPFYTGALPDVRGVGTNKTTTSQCNRVCLENVVEQVLQAMVANASSSLPLAQGVRYSENGQFLSLGNGLWETLGHAASLEEGYSARFADPASGTAAYWGLTQEHSTPGVLALRVKVENGKITEIEAASVRAESPGSRYGTLTLMRPPLPVEWEGDSLGQLDSVFRRNGTRVNATSISSTLVAAYFDGLQRHSSTGVPFKPGCLRRDNGMQGNLSCAAQMDGNGPSPNGLYNITTTVRDWRIFVIDASKGVVLAISMIDSPAIGPVPLPATELIPSTYMVMQLIKIDNGSISRVESMIKWMPFGYTSAWAKDNQAI